ncbi:hypothetical protein BS78_10G017500 [Paspalum vaginatum]|nr:hypothetical protein BS78_10G017500 [Paspalum vaginatum]
MVRVYLPLLLFSLCASSPIADATARSLRSNEAALLCSGHRVSIPLSTRGRWLPLNHRRGPCSPLPSPETESVPSTADDLILHRDRLRAGTILKGLNGTADVTVPTTLGSSLDTLEYVVTVGLGTPAVAQTVHVDTGSDVAWVQCRPCAACHPQKGAMFDPARSSTYSPLPCASAACKALGRDRLSSSGGGNGCSRKARLCQYAVNYGDGSNTTGTYGEDTLTLAGAPSHAVRDFRFGCSHATQLFGGRADGLLGLGGGSQSLVSQMAARTASRRRRPTRASSRSACRAPPRASSRSACRAPPSPGSRSRPCTGAATSTRTTSCSYRASSWPGAGSACPHRRSPPAR